MDKITLNKLVGHMDKKELLKILSLLVSKSRGAEELLLRGEDCSRNKLKFENYILSGERK